MGLSYKSGGGAQGGCTNQGRRGSRDGNGGRRAGRFCAQAVRQARVQVGSMQAELEVRKQKLPGDRADD